MLSLIIVINGFNNYHIAPYKGNFFSFRLIHKAVHGGRMFNLGLYLYFEKGECVREEEKCLVPLRMTRISTLKDLYIYKLPIIRWLRERKQVSGKESIWNEADMYRNWLEH